MKKEFCKRGHPRSGDNLNGRGCKLCMKLWIDTHYDQWNAAKTQYRHKNSIKTNQALRQSNIEAKNECLSHYGPNGELRCSWAGCLVNDVDMLTLDHINNNGAEERRNIRVGWSIYLYLRRKEYPAGYQTLCWNHQWKKELDHRRGITP